MRHPGGDDVQPAPDQARCQYGQEQQAERGVQEHQFKLFRTAGQVSRLRGDAYQHDDNGQHQPVQCFTYRPKFFFGVFSRHSILLVEWWVVQEYNLHRNPLI